MYYKGRKHASYHPAGDGNDEKFKEILRGLNKDFYHQTVTTKQVEDYFIKKSGKDLQKIFDQYLRTVQIPVLEYYFENSKFYYRYTNSVAGFNMPLKLNFDGKWQVVKPVAEKWNSIQANVKAQKEGEKAADLTNRNYYIKWQQVK